MIIDIIKGNAFNQTNTGDNQGTIWATKGIDPVINKGKINISKVLGFNTNTDDQANLEAPAVGFAFFESTGDYYYAVADDRVWKTATVNPNSGWTAVGSTPTDCDQNSDIIAFNSKLYVATANNLKSYVQSGDTWANISGGLGASPHSMCIYANRLYVSDLSEKVYSMDTAETLSKTGSYTIDINTVGGLNQQITKIMAVSDGIWIATTYDDKAGGEMIFWDGVTANVASARYFLQRGALSMTIKDDRPYVIDSLGRVRVFDGTTFVEVDRLPLKDEELDNFNSSSNNRWIHPNGMITVNDEIYMLITNLRYTSTEDFVENLPAGVWAWNKDNGLYHKYSFMDSDISGTTYTQTDYGTSVLAQVGALFRADATGGSTIDRANQSEILAGIEYYSDATTTKTAFGILDSDNNVKKAGYFVTAQITSEEVAEAWSNVVVLYDKLKNSTDKIVVKYRTSEDDPVYATGTWSEDDILRSTDDLSSVDNGDEIEILNGKGAGLCTHIKSITDDAGYRITIDETISGMSGTCKFRVQKWRKIGEIADQDGSFESFSFDSGKSSWIQFKVFTIGTGRSPQISRLVSVSTVGEDY